MNVRKWAKWRIQGITIAIVGAIIFVDGLVIWTSFPVYVAPVNYPQVMFALCGMIPVGTFMIAAGIASYYYYRDKVLRSGTPETGKRRALRLLASIGAFLLISALVLFAAAIAASGVPETPPALWLAVPFLWILGLLLLALGIGLEEKPPSGVAKL